MKYGQPLLTTSLSGRLGGVVGATARGGVGYFRRRVDGSNPNTPGQALVRSIMSSLSGAWQTTLTTPQRNAWAAKAKPSESGIDVYVRANFQQLMSGLAPAVATPPASVSLNDTPITGIAPTYDLSDDEMIFGAALPTGTDVMYNVYVSKPQSASRLSRQFPFAYLTNVAPAATDFTVPSPNVLQGATIGQVFYLRFVCFGTDAPNLGRVGEEQIFRGVVQA